MFQRLHRCQAALMLALAACACEAQGESGASSPPDSLAAREQRDTRYENGQKKEDFTVVKDKDGNYVKDGLFVAFHPSGHKSEEGAYKANARDGHWQRWDEAGKLILDVFYKDGKREGAFKDYVDGQLRQSGSYVSDQRSGSFKYFGFDGFVVSGDWSAAQPFGSWSITDKAGNARARAAFKDGKLDGPVQSLALDGSVRAAPPAKGCADFGGFALGTKRWADVIFESLERHQSFPAAGGLSEVSNGRSLHLDSKLVDVPGVEQVTLIFDEDDLLTGLWGSAPQGVGAYADAKELHAEYARKYAIVSSSMPSVGDCHGEYRNGGCAITLDAPRLAHTTYVVLRSAAFVKRQSAAAQLQKP